MQTAPHQDEQIRSTLALLRRVLGDALLGAYLHGSAVSGGLRPQSDIDLLAVVDAALAASQRKALLMDLLRLSGRPPAAAGAPRCLEVMVFCKADLAGGDYPVQAQFLYGEWLRRAFEAGEIPIPERDPEYSLIIAQARQQAISLLGPDVGELLPDISIEHVRQAMRDVLPGLLGGLRGDERNVLLTLARMWYTASTGKFLTKDAAASWAIPCLPDPDAMMLDHARRAYLGEVADDWTNQGDAARQLAERLGEFVSDALRSG